MNEEHLDKQNFLDSLPDKFKVLEAGIDAEVQQEYLYHSGSFYREELTEDKIRAVGHMLFQQEIQVSKKKAALFLLAHTGNVEAFRLIEKYNRNPDTELVQWAFLALQECRMFLENSLLEEETGFISSGLGGIDNRLRYYLFVLPAIGHTFTELQQNIVRGEFELVCKRESSFIESFESRDTFIGLVILVPLDVAVGTVIETGIKQCNELGNFLFEHYYVTNVKIPEDSEISEIIKLIME